MKFKKKQLPKASYCPVDKDIPSCDSGPFGRITWTLREVRSLFQKKGDENRNED